MKVGRRFLFRHRQRERRLTPAFPIPALRKVREGRGTRRVGDASEIKNLGYPLTPPFQLH